jgi:anthranilate synthase/indole-3-glycerol phosphate synthase/phosphoribosylanthranilate isomerase
MKIDKSHHLIQIIGMEPLVEVHTDEEMEIALSVGARVVGVNNRDLHSFQLDLDTTERVLKVAARLGRTWRGAHRDLVVAALSGISSNAVGNPLLSFHNVGLTYMSMKFILPFRF